MFGARYVDPEALQSGFWGELFFSGPAKFRKIASEF